MGKRNKDKPQYTCSVQYTQECSQRLTNALVEVYYNRKKGISKER